MWAYLLPKGNVVNARWEFNHIVYATMTVCREPRGGCPGGVEINFQKGDHFYEAMTLEEALTYFADPDLPEDQRVSEEEVIELFETYVNGYGENANVKFVQ